MKKFVGISHSLLLLIIFWTRLYTGLLIFSLCYCPLKHFETFWNQSQSEEVATFNYILHNFTINIKYQRISYYNVFQSSMVKFFSRSRTPLTYWTHYILHKSPSTAFCQVYSLQRYNAKIWRCCIKSFHVEREFIQHHDDTILQSAISIILRKYH